MPTQKEGELRRGSKKLEDENPPISGLVGAVRK
jgi:hypothetical protein